MVNPVFINSLSVELPNLPVSNDEMESILGLVGGKKSRARKLVLRSNGITQRYYAIDPETGKPNMTNAQLTARAIEKLADKDISLSDIDCLVTSTSAPDQTMPNHSVMVHGELGIDPCETVSTSGICLCGVTALKYAFMSVSAGQHETAVASGSEVSSAMMHADNFNAEYENRVNELKQKPEIAFEKDFLRWMLSDGAGAAWLSSKPNANSISLRIEWIELFSFANEEDVCMYAGSDKQQDGSLKGWTQYASQDRDSLSVFSLKQDVKLLNEKIVYYAVEKTLPLIRKKRNIQAQQVDFFLPHYSSEYFREKLYQSLQKIDFEIPYERWFTNLTTKGNTGSASIYIMLEELFHSGQLKAGHKILCFIPESGRFSSAFMLLTVC